MTKRTSLFAAASALALLVLATASTPAQACMPYRPQRCRVQRFCYSVGQQQVRCSTRRICRPYHPPRRSCYQKVCTYRYGRSHCSYQNICKAQVPPPRPVRYFYY